MKKMHYTDAESLSAHELGLTGSKDLSIRFLIGQGEGAPNFSLMLLELAPGGNTPEHSHGWEEELFVKSGRGTLKLGDRSIELQEGDVVYVEPEEQHQYLNPGAEPLEMLCAIPHPPIRPE